MKRKSNEELVGKCFHSFSYDENKEYVGCQWQGIIVGQITPEYYLVQLLSWLDGMESHMKVVCISDMTDWAIYKTDEDMKFAYETILKHSASLDNTVV